MPSKAVPAVFPVTRPPHTPFLWPEQVDISVFQVVYNISA